MLIPPAATHLSHLSCCQSHKVVNCFGDSFPKQPNDDSSNLFISNFHVKVHLKLKSVTNRVSHTLKSAEKKNILYFHKL